MRRSQHIFINPECPGTAYGMAYNCLACPDNALTCNDGYHIEHHLNSRTHWLELPARYMDNLQQHAEHQGEPGAQALPPNMLRHTQQWLPAPTRPRMHLSACRRAGW